MTFCSASCHGKSYTRDDESPAVPVSFNVPRNLISSTPLPTGRTSSKPITAVFDFVFNEIESDWHTEPSDGLKVACDSTSSCACTLILSVATSELGTSYKYIERKVGHTNCLSSLNGLKVK